MFIIEFVVFVASSGLFFNERFRHRLWAVIAAGAIAVGSSLLFVYDVGMKLTGHAEAPVKVVKQIVRVPVIEKVSRPPALSKPENCRDDYPLWSRLMGDEGTTELSFQVLADGTVSGVTVSKSSGSGRLDDAAADCVKQWHYRPGIKDGQLVDTPLKVSVAWKLDQDGADAGAK
ncbi:MAG: energy transducer TonB [Rhizomicrobium sp.]